MLEGQAKRQQRNESLVMLSCWIKPFLKPKNLSFTVT